MKLSVILPTINRSTLAQALASCRGVHEIIVVVDGPDYRGAAEVFEASGLPGRTVLLTRCYGDYGHTPRQIGLAYCSGDWITYLDDDDAYLPGAVEMLGDLLAQAEAEPHFFRVDFADLGLVWRDPELRLGNISTLGIVHPNDRRWGQWSHRYEGDYDFAMSMAANYPRVHWVDKVLARVEGHNQGKPL